jgi:WD40 repeat protein
MEQARWNELEELLQAALDLAPGERDAFLRGACGGDAELHRELAAMLAAEEHAAVLERPAIAALNLDLIGRRIAHYRIEAEIGRGGMGEVYRAYDEDLHRAAALKTLSPEFSADEQRVRRFEQEALAASRLNHPNIVTIFEVLHAEGAHWIATELVEGSTLRQVMSEPMPVERALDIAIQVAAALKAAHTAWIIHRDVKPENIMLRADGLVKVLDFGIAKLNQEEGAGMAGARTAAAWPPHSTLTAAGAILGTATYMSPEQARGEPLDGRTDIYSLGLVLREMLPPHTSNDLQRVLRRMLAPDREARYASAGELLDELRNVRRRIESRTARRMVRIGFLAVVAALVIAAVAALLSVNDVWDEHVLRDGHTAAARRAIFSPDGRLVVSCSEDDQVIVWDFARRERLATLSHPSHHLAFSPDGRWFATGGTDGTVAIWDAKTFQRLRTLRDGHTEIVGMAVSADATRLAAARFRPDDGTFVWDTRDWKRVAEYPKLKMSYGALIFSPDGRQLGWTGLFASNWMALSPDASALATVEASGDVSFYQLARNGDFDSAKRIAARRGHSDHGRAVAFSPDGRLLASGAEDIVLWDAATRQKLARFEYTSIVWSVVFSPDGRWLLSSHGDGAVLVWDVAERELVASLNEHSGAVRAVAFAPDGKRVASGGDDHSVAVWDITRGRKEAVLTGHPTRVTGVGFSGGGLASVDHDGRLILWDVARRQPRLTIVRHEDNIQGYTLTANRDLVVTTHGVFAAADGRLLVNTVNGPWLYGAVYGAAISSDGQLVAEATDLGWVMLWDVRQRRLLEARRLNGTPQIACSFSPDGKSLVTGEDEGAVRLWSVQPLQQIAILGRHAARIKSVAFSPDGRTVASAGDDKMIALWDVKRRALQARIGTHASPVYAVAFSPDGRRLASGEHDRTVRVYSRRRMLWGFQVD